MKTIIHIQDAHCNYAAQQKIADIISYFNREYSINFVNLEGGSQDYDLTIFTDIEEKEIRQKVVNVFVKKGLISGAEQFAINNPDKTILWGVEDISLYLENLKAYKDSQTNEDEINLKLEILKDILESLKINIYSKELLEMDKQYDGYTSGDIEFKDYIIYIAQKAGERSVNIDKFVNFDILMNSLEVEKKIDFKKANHERDALIEKLRLGLSNSEFEKVLHKTVGFKRNLISQDDYYGHLIRTAKFVNIDLSLFSEFSKYAEYIEMYYAMDKTEVVQEMLIIAETIKDSIYSNEHQRQLNCLSNNFVVLEKNV